MQKQISSSVLLLLLAFLLSCKKEIRTDQLQAITSTEVSYKSHVNEPSNKIKVRNISELYEAVNNMENKGSTIILAPGVYVLNAGYPKAGRLELLHNMSLVGLPGNPDAVVIDASQLPLSSFMIAPANSRTGAVRMGDGSNSMEWITFQNDPAHTIRSLIQTDIVTSSVATIKIAHCIIKGSSIGLSILNRDPVADGRVLEADISDNEIFENTIQQFGSGIQIQNTLVNDAVLKVRLSRNHVYGNKAGMMIFNSASQRCLLEVESYNDVIENNGIGLVLVGSLILNANNPALQNSLLYKAYASSIKNNNGSPAPPFSFPAGGIFAPSGLAMTQFGPPGTAHGNQLNIHFFGSDINENTGASQINAYGAYSFYSFAPFNNQAIVGTENKTNVFLFVRSTDATVNTVNSVPFEPAGTNTAAFYK